MRQRQTLQPHKLERLQKREPKPRQHPRPARRIGSNGSLHFEDSALDKPLILYQKKSLKNKIHKEIKYDTILPLDNMIKYFIDIINGKPVEIAGIEEGIETVKILESASKSLIAKQ